MLVEDTLRTCEKYLNTSRGGNYPENKAKIYHSLVLRGKLQSAVFWIMEREKEGVPQPEDTCPKTGQTVLDVLHSKHPKACPATTKSLEAYRGKSLEMVPEEITDVTVATVLQRL